MKALISDHLRTEFESVAARILESGNSVATTRDFKVILDGSPEYTERAADPLCLIFHTFPHEGHVFHVALD